MAVEKQPKSMGFGTQLGNIVLPPSLQYLARVDQITVKQKIEALEVLTGFETRNRYAILNNRGQQMFFVQEESSLCERCICPLLRGFQLRVTDNQTKEVMRFTRDLKGCTGCCWCGEGCCSMTINIESPVGHVIGKAKTGDSKWKPHLKIYDATDRHLFTIWGPCCPFQTICCTEDLDFPITDPTLTSRIGNIAKKWRGCCVESITDANEFCLTFPANMMVQYKALLMGALFLVEFYVFEPQKKNNNMASHLLPL